MSAFAPHFPRTERFTAWMGLGGLVLAGLIAWRFPAALAPAWRCAVFICVGPALGSLVFGLIHQLTGGEWAERLRPFLLSGARLLPWLWFLLSPLLFVTGEIIPGDRLSYAGPAAFAARTLFYGVIFFLVSSGVRKAWPKAGETADQKWLGPVGGIVVLFMTHLLVSDWLATLDPSWHSTAFPLVWLIGQAVAGLAMAILAGLAGGADPQSDLGHGRRLGIDWGTLLFATAMLWCYVAFAQFLIVWSGNLPEEIGWYVGRLAGFWAIVPATLIGLHFLAPLVVLLSRRAKQNRHSLMIVAALLLAGQSLHTAWMILPAFPHAPAVMPGLALLLTLAFGGLTTNRYLATIRKEGIA